MGCSSQPADRRSARRIRLGFSSWALVAGVWWIGQQSLASMRGAHRERSQQCHCSSSLFDGQCSSTEFVLEFSGRVNLQQNTNFLRLILWRLLSETLQAFGLESVWKTKSADLLKSSGKSPKPSTIADCSSVHERDSAESANRCVRFREEFQPF